MDIFSILGLVLGLGFVFYSIIMGDDFTDIDIKQFSGFVDAPSLMIVVGGTVCALMLTFPIKAFTKVPKHLKVVFAPKKYNPQEYIEQIVFFAKEARINGLLALEDKLSDVKDKFLKTSILLVVDSVEPEKVRELLNKELDFLDERHAQDMSFYLKASDYSPGFGMIGTLIGLINLLANLSDTAALTANMAVALVTTFYGSLMSNLIFKPIAGKLKARHDEEYLCKLIISEGVQAIQDGDNPTFIQEKLTRLLPSYSLKGELKEEGGEKK